MRKSLLYTVISVLLVGISTVWAQMDSRLDSSITRSENSALVSTSPRCPADFPLYCPAVDRCCPTNFGYYCTNWQSLPSPSPLSEPLSGPCLNIQAFTEGQQYYLEKYCEPHGCG